ncbi:hypothetical protein RFI_12140 [Reticulomyxa filosa]|uniref:Structure-specific endonuclease subunit SLX4 n=1 Tax=Reticulomyxa filosa TaxID=46433 RepID=X6NH06_RETFI|nr:hypothetical protein RFI_12140 [Reticulomyxa filosa]|eukprot:ETO25004.1 hypothetical protein RFI_12140 [Reticulomyxa filosa]
MYGLKHGPKNYMLQRLTMIWDILHPNSQMNNVLDELCSKNTPTVPNLTENSKTQQQQQQQQQEQNKKPNVDLEWQLLKLMASDEDLLLSMVTFQPVDFDNIHTLLKKNQVDVPTHHLRTCLDEQGVAWKYSASNEHKGPRHIRHFHKKKRKHNDRRCFVQFGFFFDLQTNIDTIDFFCTIISLDSDDNKLVPKNLQKIKSEKYIKKSKFCLRLFFCASTVYSKKSGSSPKYEQEKKKLQR